MKSPVYIGISGPIAAGKTTLAESLAVFYNLWTPQISVLRTSFAADVKYLASLRGTHDVYNSAFSFFRSLGYDEILSGVGAELLIAAFDRIPHEPNKKQRALLQYIGTELGRNVIDPNIWITSVQQRVKQNPAPAHIPHFIILDDLRFPNECAFVDLHIQITMNTDYAKSLYALRKNLYPADYFQLNHQSEQQILNEPFATIEIGFTPLDVFHLAVIIQSQTLRNEYMQLHR